MNATILVRSASLTVNAGMPLSGRPLCTTGPILSPRTSSATSAERVRSGPVCPPIASRPWQKPQYVTNSGSPALMSLGAYCGAAGACRSAAAPVLSVAANAGEMIERTMNDVFRTARYYTVANSSSPASPRCYSFPMIRRIAVILLLVSPLAIDALQPAPSPAPRAAVSSAVPRAIRRDVPLTRSIRQAFDAGTREMSGRPGPKYWQLQTDYTIEVRLDPPTDTLTGTETIALRNTSPQNLGEIVLRLDHNIFRGLVPRGPSVPAENTDGMIVTRITVNGDLVDLPPLRPTGVIGRGNGMGRRLAATGLDQTVAQINLANPIAAGATATLEISWRTKLPGGPNGRGHRMTQRWDDTLFQPTQWYPRVAKYDDLRGWDRSLYLGPAEFYNNFGRFDVRMDVPAGWLVSGTGTLQNPQEVLTAKARERLTHVLESDNVITIVGEDEVGPGKSTAPGDRLVWHFVADMVNDFAWATAKDYVWRATRATIPGKGPVPIHMVYEPSHASLYANAGSIARHALEFYSKLWAPYSFPQLTLQDGPSSGMEYPMVINSNQGAADHETGHQWWPMTVGTNETWYGWMDEGFNQYMNILSAADARGVAPDLNGLGQSYGRTSGNEEEPTMMWPANEAGRM